MPHHQKKASPHTHHLTSGKASEIQFPVADFAADFTQQRDSTSRVSIHEIYGQPGKIMGHL
jgi:hypothetical protein